MRDSLGNMSALALVILALLAYCATATILVRHADGRWLYILATCVGTFGIATILFALYRAGQFSFYPGTPRAHVVQTITGWTVAAIIAVVPPITATTVLARRFAVAASPVVRNWVLTSVGAVAVLIVSSVVAFWAAMVITGDGP